MTTSSASRPAAARAMAVAAGLAVAGGLSPEPALSSGWQTGQQIAGLCAAEPDSNPAAVTFCLGYLQGALDAFLLGRAACIPEGVDAQGLRLAVLDHVRRHPERVVGTSGPLLVYDAFRAAWPSCAHMPAVAG